MDRLESLRFSRGLLLMELAQCLGSGDCEYQNAKTHSSLINAEGPIGSPRVLRFSRGLVLKLALFWLDDFSHRLAQAGLGSSRVRKLH